MLTILPIPAFQDNYIWLLVQDSHAAVVDPGDASPVITYLKQHNLQLDAILITHHHSDHIDGVEQLQREYACETYAPKHENFNFIHKPLGDGESILLGNLGLKLSVIEVPGHTLGHIAYYDEDILFCGDTLFSAGCGRLFEGTPGQMFASLQKLASLPAQTKVFCTHEYTEHNLGFAMTVEPGNQDLIDYRDQVRQLRSHNKPSLPSSIGQELKINPFLRCNQPEIARHAQTKDMSPIAVFTAIRNMRNHY